MLTDNKMTTSEIKRGLENIKQAQLEVLRELRGEQYNSKSGSESHAVMNSAQQQKVSSSTSRQVDPVTEAQATISKKTLQIQEGTSSLRSLKGSQHSAELQRKRPNFSQEMKNSSDSISTRAEIQTIKQEVRQEKEELHTKIDLISSKLREMEDQNRQLYSEKEKERQQLRGLERQKFRLEEKVMSLQQKVFDSEQLCRRQKVQLEQIYSQKLSLEQQVGELKTEVSKRTLENNDMANRLESVGNLARNKDGADCKAEKIVREVKKISSWHDSIYQKLRSVGKLELKQLNAEQNLQAAIGRLLDSLESDMLPSPGFQADADSEADFSLREDLRGLEQKVQEEHKAVLSAENQSLKERIQVLEEELRANKAESEGYLWQKERIDEEKKKEILETTALMNAEIFRMKSEVARLSSFKQSVKEQEEEREESLKRLRVKLQESELKVDQLQQKVSLLNEEKHRLEKKVQEKDIQLEDFKAIISRLSAKKEQESESESGLRSEFNKLIENNGVLLREKESLRAMNEGLQVQVQNLKFESSQNQENNRQKHDLIEREVREKKNLIEELEATEKKSEGRKRELFELKDKLQLQEAEGEARKEELQRQVELASQENLKLRREIDKLYRESGQLYQLRQVNAQLEESLKEQRRRNIQMTESLAHLWSVKEAEYHNLNQVLGLAKQSSSRDSPSRNLKR